MGNLEGIGQFVPSGNFFNEWKEWKGFKGEWEGFDVPVPET
jgi:hypothetical protein